VKYPDECPVFRISEKVKTGVGGKLAVGVGFYSVGLIVEFTCSEGDPYVDRIYVDQTHLHYRWLRPLTPAAREMKDALRRDMLDANEPLFPKEL
jgi:hypothetical protein